MTETESLLFWERIVVDINNGQYDKYRTPIFDSYPSYHPEKKCLFCNRFLSRRFKVVEYCGSMAGTPEAEQWFACNDCVKQKTWFRADNGILCKICGKEYRLHPEASQGLSFLRVICGGQLVKL